MGQKPRHKLQVGCNSEAPGPPNINQIMLKYISKGSLWRVSSVVSIRQLLGNVSSNWGFYNSSIVQNGRFPTKLEPRPRKQKDVVDSIEVYAYMLILSPFYVEVYTCTYYTVPSYQRLSCLRRLFSLCLCNRPRCPFFASLDPSLIELCVSVVMPCPPMRPGLLWYSANL